MNFVFTITEATMFYIPSTRTPPSARVGIGLAIIPSTYTLLTFGGSSGNDYFDDTWTFNILQNYWKEVLISTESRPCNLYIAPRNYYGIFSSALSKKIYIFGGNSYLGLKNDFWEYDHEYSKWTELKTINPPSLRRSFSYTSFVKDENEIFVIFGGETENGINNELFM